MNIHIQAHPSSTISCSSRLEVRYVSGSTKTLRWDSIYEWGTRARFLVLKNFSFTVVTTQTFSNRHSLQLTSTHAKLLSTQGYPLTRALNRHACSFSLPSSTLTSPWDHDIRSVDCDKPPCLPCGFDYFLPILLLCSIDPPALHFYVSKPLVQVPG